MGYEISEFDIPDRQLLATSSPCRVRNMSDVGEAKITHTIFGRVRVRVIREQDRKRRAWLLAALVATAIAAAGWKGWIISQQMQYPAPPAPLSERIEVSQPVFRPANIPPDPHPSSLKSESLIQTEIDRLLSGPLPRHPPPGLSAAAKRAKSEPLAANKPQITSVTTIKNPSMNQTDRQPALKHSAALQPLTATVARSPRHAPDIPGAVAPLGMPLDASTPLPAGNGQPQGPVSAQD